MSKDDSALSALEQDKRHHFHPMTNPVALREAGPDMVKRAEGIHWFLHDGRKVMDMYAGLANVMLGYGHRRLCEAAFEAMKELSYCQTIVGRSNPYVAALSEKLAEITPRQYQSFFFASSGSEANESALKMALHYWRLRGKPGKRLTLARRGSYHGSTFLTSSLTGNPVFHTQFGLPLSSMVEHIDTTNWYQEGKGRSRETFYRDLVRSLESQILKIGPERIAALIGEPVQTGLFIPEPVYWRGVRELCDRYEIVLIADEVVTGFGKTGRMFGFEHFGFEPDIFSMAKGMTSGYFPLSAVAIGKKVSEVIQEDNAVFAHVFTNSGHPVGAAVALATLSVIEEEGLVDRVRDDIGPYFAKSWSELAQLPYIKDVRSFGVQGAFDVDAAKGDQAASREQNDVLKGKIAAIAWRRGMSMRGSAVCLPMIVTRKQVDEAMNVLRESIAEATAAVC